MWIIRDTKSHAWIQDVTFFTGKPKLTYTQASTDAMTFRSLDRLETTLKKIREFNYCIEVYSMGFSLTQL